MNAMIDHEPTNKELTTKLIKAIKKNAIELEAADERDSTQNADNERHVSELIVLNEVNALELIIVNKKLIDTNNENDKRAEELINAYRELKETDQKLAFLKKEKEKRAAELNLANKELAYQNVEKQKGRCYYSGITYSFVNKSNWQCSLERLDPNIGYVVGNIALVIIELNNASQWSLEKIKCFIDISYTIHEYQHIDFTFDTSKSLRGLIHIKKKETNINDIQYIKCNKCDTFKTIDFFLKKSSYGCKPCRDMDRRHANNNPRRHMQNMICHMIKHTKERNKKGRGHGLCEYTFDDIVKLWGEQGGLCAYSRIPMTFGSHKDMWWTCSPERIDETKGYIKGNVCLICHEFNTSTQWSKAKVDFLKSALSAKKI